MSDKDTVEYEEKLLEGKVLLFSRSGIFQVRLYKGDRRYIYRSLKTRDLKAAREEAVRAYYEVEFRKREQLPVQSKRFADVLNEFETRARKYYNFRMLTSPCGDAVLWSRMASRGGTIL